MHPSESRTTDSSRTPAPSGADRHDPAVTPLDIAAAEAPVLVSRWAIHRHLYDWVLALAHKPYAASAMATLSFAESSFFPIPPDVMLLPMCLEKRASAWRYATLCTVASVAGGLLGYFIGAAIWASVSGFFFQYIISEATFEQARDLYTRYDFWAVFAAAFTPIPFKVFTIAAGICDISIPMFIIASLVGRGMRFYLLAALAYFFGPPVVRFIDRYFNLVTVAMLVLGVGGFAAVKLLR